MKLGQSSKDKFRAERKETLREYLKARGHDQHAFEIIMKLQNLSDEIEVQHVNRLRIALDGHFRFINKYIPDVKAVEVNDQRDHDTPERLRERLGELVDIGAARSGKRGNAS